MARNRNKLIWDKAIPLSEAWRKFASAEMLRELDELPSGLDTLKETAAQHKPDDPRPTLFEAVELLVSNPLKSSVARATKIAELQELLLDELFNKNLVALGYRELPSTSAAPVEIASDFFDTPVIKWKQETVTAYGKRYGRVRVYGPYELAIDKKRHMGRPSSAQKIETAIKLAMKSDIDFCSLPRKIACEKIRQLIGENVIAGDGLSDKNLSKYILIYCSPRNK